MNSRYCNFFFNNIVRISTINNNLNHRVVAVSGTSEDSQKPDEKNNASNNEQVQWAISVSDNSSNQPATSNDEQHSIHENSRFLRSLTNYIVKDKR